MILMLDDQEDCVALFKRVAAAEGITEEIVWVSNGIAAQAVLTDPAIPLPSVVVADLHMPGMSGLEFIRWLRRDPRSRHVPVVVVTGSSETLDFDWARYLNVTAFFMKPNTLEGFRNIIATVQRVALAPAKAS